jgi:hypothetical protein
MVLTANKKKQVALYRGWNAHVRDALRDLERSAMIQSACCAALYVVVLPMHTQIHTFQLRYSGSQGYGKDRQNTNQAVASDPSYCHRYWPHRSHCLSFFPPSKKKLHTHSQIQRVVCHEGGRQMNF